LLLLSVSGRLGGAERVLVDIVAVTRGLQPDWAIHVLSVEEGPLRREVESLGASYDVLPLPRLFAATGEHGRHPVITAARLAMALPSLVRYARALGKRLDEVRPDIVHANGLKAHVLSSWVAGEKTRLVWHVHDYVSTRAMSAWLFRRCSGRAAAILANSDSVAADVRRLVAQPARVHVLHNGVDTTRFRPDGPSQDLDAAAGLRPAPVNTVRVGLVGTYAKWKGHEVFLRAMSRLDPRLHVRGYIVGGPLYQTGPSQWTRAALQTLATGLGLGDRIGFVEFQAETAPVYRALDVVVHASTQPEPFGLVVAEAMACGRAVIVSDAGGAREIGQPEHSVITHRPADVADLTAQISRLAADAPLRSRLGESAASAVRRDFSTQRMGRTLHAIYATL
jgi:glycosyltransferase involved in cell wall biosynthesis